MHSLSRLSRNKAVKLRAELGAGRLCSHFTRAGALNTSGCAAEPALQGEGYAGQLKLLLRRGACYFAVAGGIPRAAREAPKP